MPDPSFLQVVWFALIGVLWVGYFVLEGFDFGVGMLLRAVSRDDAERRMVIHSIGPVWDGNEVWLLVAGGATFAAFPGWYASLFSGFYLALFLVLVALIVRGVCFEFWGKHDTRRWRATWEWALAGSSFVAALLWGVAWANITHGVAMNRSHDVTAGLFDLLTPYALLGGLTSLALFAAHGALFLGLRTSGEVLARARKLARSLVPTAALLVLAFLVWTVLDQAGLHGFDPVVALLAAGAIALVLAAAFLVIRNPDREGWAFALSAGAIGLWFVTLFVALFPAALPSTTNAAFSLSLADASSTDYTLKVMTVVAVTLLPVVLAYQAWTYWIFRHRLGRDDFEGTPTPLAVIEHTRQSS